ncbi:MAG: hypothetical protein WBL21_11825 [Salinimicrobium sp.]
MTRKKKNSLITAVVYDAIGMATVAIPLVGPFLDLLWAPFAAKKMADMYPGKKGKLASVVVFIEEILPFTDVIPTFTLMWIYTYVWNKEPVTNGNIIEVEAY